MLPPPGRPAGWKTESTDRAVVGRPGGSVLLKKKNGHAQVRIFRPASSLHCTAAGQPQRGAGITAVSQTNCTDSALIMSAASRALAPPSAAGVEKNLAVEAAAQAASTAPADDASEGSDADAGGDDAPTIELHIKCPTGPLLTLDHVPATLTVADLKRRIHATRADLPAHLQRLAVATLNGDESARVVLGNNEPLDSFACVTDGCTIDVIPKEGRATFIGAVYMAAVLEYLSAEVLELAGNAARERNKENISVCDIRAAVANDEELSKLIDCLAIYHKRTLPFMFPELDTEFADNLVESKANVGAYKYAHWGRDQDEREDAGDDEHEPPADELARQGVIEDEEDPDDDSDDDSDPTMSPAEARSFLGTDIKPLILRRGVSAILDLEYQESIRKVLKQVHAEKGITEQGMATVNLIVNLALNVIASFAFYCAAEGCEKTLTCLAVQNALIVTFPGELVKHAVSEGTKAVTRFVDEMHRFDERNQSGRCPRLVTFSDYAGLQFPLYQRYLDAAFADFRPEPVHSAAMGSFHIAVQPRFSHGFGHAICLEVTRDDCVGDVASRARDAFRLSPPQEYALAFSQDFQRNITGQDDASETLLDVGRSLGSCGIDANCLNAFINPPECTMASCPSLVLHDCKVAELSLKVIMMLLNVLTCEWPEY